MKEKEKDKDPKARRRPGRVPTSCAECRRLKLRCDKKVPCEKCVSRGCGAICPDGSLTAGKGNRLVLANTEELHDRIDHLCSRIRELENALRAVQSQVSEESHPLLRSDLLQLKAPGFSVNAPASLRGTNTNTNGGAATNSTDSSLPSPTSFGQPRPTSGGAGAPAEDENLVDAFGTLSIGANGESSFLGKTARSEYLIRALSRPPRHSTSDLPRLSKKIIESSCRADSNESDTSLGLEVFSLLPPLSEAIHLCEVYLGHGYMYTPIPRTELFDEILSCVYRAESFSSVQCHHSLALLFIVFALAALYDPERPSYSVEAQEYFYLARAALNVDPLFRNTTLKAIQTCVHMAQFLEFSDWESLGSESAWGVAGSAVRLGVSIGLHLDSSRFKLSEDMQQRRYRVFWQVFTVDTWLSFHYGRPPTLSRVYIDCPFPKDTEEIVNVDGQRETGFHSWTWQYTAFMHIIMESAFACKSPSYSTIVEFDRKIRDFPVPLGLRVRCTTVEPQLRPEVYMQRFIVLCYKESTLLNLHRAYFAQALQDSPNDLTNHKYIPSVMATYRSAWRLIEGLKIAWLNVPQLLSRYNLAWSQALSAAIVMCILVTRAPTSKMTKPSLEELEVATKLFENAAPLCKSAANIADTIANLRGKAQEAVDQTDNVSEFHQSNLKLDPEELDRLGGRTHLISRSEAELGDHGKRGVGGTHQPTTSDGSSPSSSSSNGCCSSSNNGSTISTPASSTCTSPPCPTQVFPPQQPGPSNTSASPTITPNANANVNVNANANMFQMHLAAQKMHPTIAQDMRNMTLNLNGAEFNFCDSSDVAVEPYTAIFRRERGGYNEETASASTSTSGSAYSPTLNANPNAMSTASTTATTTATTATNDSPGTTSDRMSGVRFEDEDMNDMGVDMEEMSEMVGGGMYGQSPSSGSGVFSPSQNGLGGLGGFSDLNGPMNSPLGMGMGGMGMGMGMGMGVSGMGFAAPLSAGAPILDATWQSFVEQLGF